MNASVTSGVNTPLSLETVNLSSLGTRLADDTPHFGNTGIGGATGNMGTPT